MMMHAVDSHPLEAALVKARLKSHRPPSSSVSFSSCLHTSAHVSLHHSHIVESVRGLSQQGMKSPSDASNQWGSYFVDVSQSGGGDEESQKLTWCCHSIHKYSTMAIPSVEHIAGMHVADLKWFDGVGEKAE